MLSIHYVSFEPLVLIMNPVSSDIYANAFHNEMRNIKACKMMFTAMVAVMFLSS